MTREKSYFFIGLIIFYLIISFSPHKLVYFGAYFVAAFFFYLSTKNLGKSLSYTLILSLFSDIGLASSYFLVEPQELNFGSGYWISPMTILLLCLLPLAIKMKIKKLKAADLLLVVFFLWNILTFIFLPNQNVLYGLFSLGEIIIVYFLFRIYLKKDNLGTISQLLISMLFFQSIVGFMQFILKRPIGILAESSTFLSPFGLVTAEDVNLYRLTGTFAHPNNFAASLLAILPFLLLLKFKNRRFLLLSIVPLFVLFFTYSRAAWAIFTVIFILILYIRKIKIKLPSISIPSTIFALTIFIVCSIFLAPFIIARINSIPQALEVRGSGDVRMKLIEEGLSIISAYPITGVGLNRSVEAYAYNPVTDLVEITRGLKYYKIHNVFLEFAAETGIPGLILFMMFIISAFWNYWKSEKNYYRNAAFFGLIGLIGMSMFNPFLHSSQLRLFFLLSAIILV